MRWVWRLLTPETRCPSTFATATVCPLFVTNWRHTFLQERIRDEPIPTTAATAPMYNLVFTLTARRYTNSFVMFMSWLCVIVSWGQCIGADDSALYDQTRPSVRQDGCGGNSQYSIRERQHSNYARSVILLGWKIRNNSTRFSLNSVRRLLREFKF